VRARVVARVARPLAPRVADALDAQHARLAPSAARAAHLAALRRGAAAVVTGQQCGLFLGPLFTFYKAASAVAVARALAAETGRPVVPIFWVQNEDHDLPEIATCQVPRAHGTPLALSLPASPGDRASVAHRTLPDEVDALVAALRAELGNLPHAAEHVERLARHYRPGAGWDTAFARTLAELFADEGLVLVDARDPAIARATAPIHRRALVEATAIAAALRARGEALVAAGHAPAVHVRAGAPLSFFHPDGPAGARHRLEPAEGGGFVEVGGGGRHTLDALLGALASDPRRFSTSALLRPVLQDALLPTAAYVAGPGEVAYFAQLAPLYDLYDVTMPLVVPRARLRLVEERTRALCARLGVELDGAPHETPAPSPAARADAAVVEALGARLDEAVEAVRAHVERIGPGLDVALTKTRHTVADAVARLARKVVAAHEHRDRARAEALAHVRWALAPSDMPQERFYGLAYFAARYGERTLVTRVLDAIDPFDPTPKDLAL
jgi:bacillithiol biosynthesis cysteine-adding enzyme BshC